MAQTSLVTSHTPITYRLKRHHAARVVRLRIEASGQLTITAPRRISLRMIDRMVAERTPWILTKRQEVVSRGSERRSVGGSYHTHRARALQYIRAKVAIWNREYGFSYDGIGVRNQSTRWGSCSTSGTLTFNYRLFFLPEPLTDYVVVHELCHLAHMNHSQAFWQLVAKTIPDHRHRRTALRQHSL